MTPGDRAAELGRYYREACLLELRALKPGNVHIHASGHRMTLADLEISARVSAAPLARAGSPVGRRILEAITATHAAVGSNTNLGIVLLAAPLLAAAETSPVDDLRRAVLGSLARLTVEDAAAAYAAIRLAAPAGLGSATEQDVARPPSVDLRRAMTLAAGRDRIARQYATGYDDVFSIGVAQLTAAHRERQPPEWAATRAFMAFLAAFPDSHIERKLGAKIAETVRAQAAALLADLDRGPADQALTAALLDFDGRLKADGVNPGTSADLTVASLLAFSLSGSRTPGGR